LCSHPKLTARRTARQTRKSIRLTSIDLVERSGKSDPSNHSQKRCLLPSIDRQWMRRRGTGLPHPAVLIQENTHRARLPTRTAGAGLTLRLEPVFQDSRILDAPAIDASRNRKPPMTRSFGAVAHHFSAHEPIASLAAHCSFLPSTVTHHNTGGSTPSSQQLADLSAPIEVQ
jgi:hypothetical protein